MTAIKLFTGLLATVLLVAPMVTAASDKDAHAQIVSIIEAIELGWEEADGAPFRRHFLDSDNARYVESGGQNTGLDDLIDHHVEPEGGEPVWR